MKARLIILGLVLFFESGFSQPAERKISREEYIETYKDEAVREMLRTGIPASITMAQAILESGDGNSPLARYANNHFGIKCHSDWTGKTFYVDDDKPNECFRKYHSVLDSYKDHSDFLKNKSRYAALFELKITDYEGWAKGLKKAGYATNPKYPELLISLIEKHSLYELDRLGKVPPKKHKKETPTIEMEAPKRLVKIHNNNIKYTIVKSGDSFFKIANEFDMALWQILKYNDLNKSDIIHPGDVIYLQPKRNKAKEEFHTVKKGETMREISQEHGIKLKKLYKKNNMIQGTSPQVGQKLSLRKKL